MLAGGSGGGAGNVRGRWERWRGCGGVLDGAGWSGRVVI